MDNVARTALMVAAYRAKENNRPNRLFYDPLSSVLAGQNALKAAATRHRDDTYPYLTIRTRFFDDWLEKTLGSTYQQVVFLGAGMDTRAFRLKWPDAVQLWEIDCREVLALKQARLSAVQAKARCGRIPVAADLSTGEWANDLLRHGFRTGVPSVWIAEGLFMYLPSSAVSQILCNVAALAPAGSQFGAEVFSEDFLHDDRNRTYLKEAAARGTPWLFGCNEPEEFFARCGWRIGMITGPGGEGADFGRWPKPTDPRHPAGVRDRFFVIAARA